MMMTNMTFVFAIVFTLAFIITNFINDIPTDVIYDISHIVDHDVMRDIAFSIAIGIIITRIFNYEENNHENNYEFKIDYPSNDTDELKFLKFSAILNNNYKNIYAQFTPQGHLKEISIFDGETEVFIEFINDTVSSIYRGNGYGECACTRFDKNGTPTIIRVKDKIFENDQHVETTASIDIRGLTRVVCKKSEDFIINEDLSMLSHIDSKTNIDGNIVYSFFIKNTEGFIIIYTLVMNKKGLISISTDVYKNDVRSIHHFYKEQHENKILNGYNKISSADILYKNDDIYSITKKTVTYTTKTKFRNYIPEYVNMCIHIDNLNINNNRFMEVFKFTIKISKVYKDWIVTTYNKGYDYTDLYEYVLDPIYANKVQSMIHTITEHCDRFDRFNRFNCENVYYLSIPEQEKIILSDRFITYFSVCKYIHNHNIWKDKKYEIITYEQNCHMEKLIKCK